MSKHQQIARPGVGVGGVGAHISCHKHEILHSSTADGYTRWQDVNFFFLMSSHFINGLDMHSFKYILFFANTEIHME